MLIVLINVAIVHTLILPINARLAANPVDRLLTVKGMLMRRYAMNLSKKYKPKTCEKKMRCQSRILALLAILISGQAFAQYEMRKHSINSGGVVKSSASFELNSSMAQVDANQKSSAANASVSSGYWQQNNDLIFRNNFK